MNFCRCAAGRWLRAVWGAGLCAGLWLGLCGAGWAQADAQGRAPNYDQALEALAVGDVAGAQRLLESVVAQDPLHAGALLDLALLACSLGQTQSALRLFDELQRRYTPPPGVLALIAAQRASGCQAASPKRWQGWLRWGGGWDSNVNQGPNDDWLTLGQGATALRLQLAPAQTPQSSGFADWGGEISAALPWAGWRAVAAAQGRTMPGLHDFDTTTLVLGLQHRQAQAAQSGAGADWQVGLWHGASALGGLWGTAFEQVQVGWLSAATASGWRATLGSNWLWLRYRDVPEYNAVQADAWVGLRWQTRTVWLGADVGRRLDTAVGARPGGNRDGTTWALQAGWQPAPQWQLQTGLEGGQWRSAQAYAPGLIDTPREPSWRAWRVGWTWQFAPAHSAYAQWREMAQDDPVSLFAFRSAALGLGWQWNF